MKKAYILLSAVFFFSVLPVFVLYFLSKRINHYDNAFIRLFPPHPVMFDKAIDVKYNSYYIAGATRHQVYLGNFAAPLHLLVADAISADTQHVRLTLMDPDLLKLKTVEVRVDSPYFYVTNGVKPAILKGTTANWHARRYMYDSAYFTEAIPISPTSFALRSIRAKEYILSKESNVYPYIRAAPGLLVKQVDGLFCTDGMMHYNTELNMLVYLYHYRNEFICMDSSLNLLYKGKTIDTVSRAQVKVAPIRSENAITLAEPPLMVNKGSSVSGNYLFVHSGLPASNENRETYDQAAVIDVYTIQDGIYQFSFYLYDFNGQKLHGFKVAGNKLIALYNHYVVIYTLMPRNFRHLSIDGTK